MHAAVTTKRVHASRLSFASRQNKAGTSQSQRTREERRSELPLHHQPPEWACGVPGRILLPPATRCLQGCSDHVGSVVDELMSQQQALSSPLFRIVSCYREQHRDQERWVRVLWAGRGAGHTATWRHTFLSIQAPPPWPSAPASPGAFRRRAALFTLRSIPAAQINGAAPRIRTTARAFSPARSTWTVWSLVCFYWQVT